MLRNRLRILILDDFPDRGWVLSRILNSKGYSANSHTFPQNEVDIIEKKNPDLLILDLIFSEASIVRTLKKIKQNNPSLPVFICFNSVTKQIKNQATKLGASVFSPRAEVEQMLDQIKKLPLVKEERDLVTPCVSKDEKERR